MVPEWKACWMTEEEIEMTIATVGIDLAKNVIQVHQVDERGETVVKKQLWRDQVLPWFANLPPCVLRMEACGSAHDWTP